MLKQKQKITHLMDELLHYVLETEPEQVVITIKDLPDRVQMSIDQVGTPRDEQECRRVERLLNAPRRNELRDYYGGLAGEEDCGSCDLRVVSMLIDGGHIEPTEQGTRLTVWWKKE
ncbi:MAG: hypothetical protein JXA89_17700 [Anaerolineae bacterium]|nr:hypothetical protein [Anaerolineae bacterium]